MQFPDLSHLAATGVGESFPSEVAHNPDVMVEILTALSAGDPEEACKTAARWCASHQDACQAEFALWRDLRIRIFPNTLTHPFPLYARSRKHWFYMLCQGLEEALAKHAAAALNLRLAQQQPFAWPTYKGIGKNRDGTEKMISDVRGTTRDLQFEYDLADLKLQVILSGRFRKSLAYTKGSPWKPRAGYQAPQHKVPFERPHAVVLTWGEMEAQLDRLEGRTGPSGASGDGGSK